MNLGSLRSILNNHTIRITIKIMIKIAISIARGMNYLHTQSPAILHRDLNSHNILSTTNWTIKVADYGLSRTMDATMDFCGAVPWRAPEVDRGVYFPASDVYSYGIYLSFPPSLSPFYLPFFSSSSTPFLLPLFLITAFPL